MTDSDRRLRRSEDPLVALHYQLATSRTHGDLDAIVVADISGVVVAGAGSWATCEELAAYAPFFDEADGGLSSSVSQRLTLLRAEVEVRRLSLGASDVLVCARGGTLARGASLDRAATGVKRILRAA